jgi:hypothetical protein
VRSFRRIPGGVVLTLGWDDELAGVFDDYLALTRKYTPDVERRLAPRSASDATLEVLAPEGFLQSFELSLARRGVDVESA